MDRCLIELAMNIPCPLHVKKIVRDQIRFYDSMAKTRRVNCHLLYYLTNSICDQDELDDDSSRKINKTDRDKI